MEDIDNIKKISKYIMISVSLQVVIMEEEKLDD